MTVLFASIYLDEDVDVLLADLLRSRGFQALTARDAEQLHRSDADQLAFAAANGMAILTHNRDDFVALHRDYHNSGRSHSGILIAVRRPPHSILLNLLRLLDQLTADELQGQLLYL